MTGTKTAICDERVFTVEGLVSEQECQALIGTAEELGFGAAPITTHRGFVMAPEVRNNSRVMFDDSNLAVELWGRLRPFVPPQRRVWSAIGLNERLRIYRYQPGQRFRWHHDGSFERSESERSCLTVMLYLNDDFTGGTTDFDYERLFSVKPIRGAFLVFDHGLLHQGSKVVSGVKYVLRTDVMYRR